MKKIIKHGFKNYMATTCPYCGCEFTYELGDLELPRQEWFLNGTTWKAYSITCDNSFITCPDCECYFKINNYTLNIKKGMDIHYD